MRLGIIQIVFQGHFHGIAGSFNVPRLFVVFRKLQPVRGAVRIQLHGGFVFFTGTNQIQVLGGVVVNVPKHKMVVRIVRVVLGCAFVYGRLGCVSTRDPGCEEKPPGPVKQRTAGHQDQRDRDEFAWPTVESDLPVSVDGGTSGRMPAKAGIYL